MKDNMNTSKNILVVDDDPAILQALSLRLRAAGYDVITVNNGADALVLAETKTPDLIIADIWMPVGAGFSLAYRLNEAARDIPIIFLTASKKPGLKEGATDLGAAAFLEKPYEPEVLLATVSEVLEFPRRRLGATT